MAETVLQGHPAGVREVELPSYQSHKVVRAAKILTISVRTEDGTYRLALEGPAYVDVTKLWVTQRQPAPGGYFVQYEDGYSSFSPAPQFESGYTPLDAAAPAEAEPHKIVLVAGDFVQIVKKDVPQFDAPKPIILIDSSNDLVFVEGGDDKGYPSDWLAKTSIVAPTGTIDVGLPLTGTEIHGVGVNPYGAAPPAPDAPAEAHE